MIIGYLGEDDKTIYKQLQKLEINETIPLKFSKGFCVIQDKWQNAGILHDAYMTADGQQGLVVFGKIYSLSSQGNQPVSAQSLYQLFQQKGVALFNQLNGDFIMLVWDQLKKTSFIVRDPVGTFPLYFHQTNQGVYFSSNLNTLATSLSASINENALIQYLIYNYNPGVNSIYQNIKKLRSGHYLQYEDRELHSHPYWELSFTPSSMSENDITDALRSKLKKAVHNRLASQGKTGVFLSGGLDSSSMTSLLHQENVDPLSTFSFRCKGESFDESPFAKKVSDAFQTVHHVVEYAPDSVKLIQEMVAFMDEPFCDVGINVATYLLTQSAKGKVNTLFTGDGGDELFAGHPVYLADMSAVYLKYIPSFLKSIAFSLGRQLKDSDKKKDLRVKVKRFSESYAYPAELGTHRWRAYYMPETLGQLFKSEIAEQFVSDGVFDEMIQYNEEGNQYDALSQSLYSDYQTVVQFYLRRMDFARKQGLWPQFPMLDKEVIEFCAGIPSKLKIPSMSETKYIEKKTIEPWLPHEIVYRKDKLGHSIPLKNWMRYDDDIQTFMIEILKNGSLEKMGLFNMQMVDTMIQEHLNKKVNHSHRLWALMVLALWMEK